jgi:hypothetical protein
MGLRAGIGSRRALSGAVAMLVLGALQVARADDAEVKLAHVYKEKDTARYKQVIKTSVAGMDIVLTAINKDTVKEVKQNGEVLVVHENESSKMELNGAEQPGQATASINYTFDKTGKLVDYKPGDTGGFFDPGIAQLVAIAHTIALPEKPVKKDDKWEIEVDDPAVKGKKMTIKQAFLGTEKHDGKDLWKIKQTLEAPVDDAGGKTTFELTYLLDPATGQTVHAEGSVKDLPTTQAGAVSWTEETDMLKPNADKKVADADKKP